MADAMEPVSVGIKSYLGVPLSNSEGKHLGHLAVFDDKPMLAGSGQRFRDLF